MAEGHDGGGSSPEPHATPETGSHHPALAEASAAPSSSEEGRLLQQVIFEQRLTACTLLWQPRRALFSPWAFQWLLSPQDPLRLSYLLIPADIS